MGIFNFKKGANKMSENEKELISKALEKADEGAFDKLTDNELEAVAGGGRPTSTPKPGSQTYKFW